MLDNPASIAELDSSGFFKKLTNLPNSYEGPDGLQKEPYGLMAYGECSSLPGLFKSWIDAPIVLSGTQFLFAGGFDYGEAAPLRISAELAGAKVVTLGYGVHEPNIEILPDVLSTYTYTGYLAHATGHKEDWQEANMLMTTLLEVMKPEVETAQNPAKTLAWNLWNRVPLVTASRRQNGLNDMVQRLLARVGKSLAITTSEHPLEVLTGAFEGRHQLGDDVVGLLLGDPDEEMRLTLSVLESRVAQVERIALPFGGIGEAPADAGAYNLVLWYISLWVSAYLAILHKFDPVDTNVYEEARANDMVVVNPEGEDLETSDEERPFEKLN